MGFYRLIFVTSGWGITCKIPLRWLSLDLTDDESTLVHVMTWCRQATSHYMKQWWSSFKSPYGVIRQQWVNIVSIFLLNIKCVPTSAFTSASMSNTSVYMHPSRVWFLWKYNMRVCPLFDIYDFNYIWYVNMFNNGSAQSQPYQITKRKVI